MSAIGTKRTSLVAPHMSAIGGKADIERRDFRGRLLAAPLSPPFPALTAAARASLPTFLQATKISTSEA